MLVAGLVLLGAGTLGFGLSDSIGLAMSMRVLQVRGWLMGGGGTEEEEARG